MVGPVQSSPRLTRPGASGRGGGCASRPRSVPRGQGAWIGTHVPIYWGAYWTTKPGTQLATQLDAFFDVILPSSLMSMLSEYSTPDNRDRNRSPAPIGQHFRK